VKFVESVKTVIIEKYATFNGRSSRSEYWWYMLFLFLIQILATVIFLTFITKSNGYQEYNPIEIILSLALFIPSLAVSIRRLHDTNKSGWWLLSPFAAGAVFGILAYILSKIGLEDSAFFIFIIPMGVMNLYLFYLMLKISDKGENKYGHNCCSIPR
jgi:uncharacterized membrane protein YhaH (DUF805 family)